MGKSTLLCNSEPFRNWRFLTLDDFDIVEPGRRAAAVEIKSTKNPDYRDTAGQCAFLDEDPTASAGLLVHQGSEIKLLGDKILAIPWTLLTG